MTVTRSMTVIGMARAAASNTIIAGITIVIATSTTDRYRRWM
jgi:hypothetical protein